MVFVMDVCHLSSHPNGLPRQEEHFHLPTEPGGREEGGSFAHLESCLKQPFPASECPYPLPVGLRVCFYGAVVCSLALCGNCL